MLKLKQRGKNTSKIDIHISENGLWLLVKDAEYFCSLSKRFVSARENLPLPFGKGGEFWALQSI